MLVEGTLIPSLLATPEELKTFETLEACEYYIYERQYANFDFRPLQFNKTENEKSTSKLLTDLGRDDIGLIGKKLETSILYFSKKQCYN